MKVLLSILLGLMLSTSLVGISYATPTVNIQPTAPQNNSSCSVQGPNGSNMNYTQNCHDAGNGGRDPHNCVDNQKAPDGCCRASISPQGLQVSDIQPDVCER